MSTRSSGSSRRGGRTWRCVAVGLVLLCALLVSAGLAIGGLEAGSLPQAGRVIGEVVAGSGVLVMAVAGGVGLARSCRVQMPGRREPATAGAREHGGAGSC